MVLVEGLYGVYDIQSVEVYPTRIDCPESEYTTYHKVKITAIVKALDIKTKTGGCNEKFELYTKVCDASGKCYAGTVNQEYFYFEKGDIAEITFYDSVECRQEGYPHTVEYTIGPAGLGGVYWENLALPKATVTVIPPKTPEEEQPEQPEPEQPEEEITRLELCKVELIDTEGTKVLHEGCLTGKYLGTLEISPVCDIVMTVKAPSTGKYRLKITHQLDGVILSKDIELSYGYNNVTIPCSLLASRRSGAMVVIEIIRGDNYIRLSFWMKAAEPSLVIGDIKIEVNGKLYDPTLAPIQVNVPFTIHAKAMNPYSSPKTFTIKMYIDGELTDSKTISFNPLETKDISFTTTIGSIGVHEVCIK